MKRYTSYIILLIVACLFALTTRAQNNFSESDLSLIDQKVDSLISEYLRYASFMSENDLTNISEEYLEAFPGLFSSPYAEVVNDLDFSNTTAKKITVAQYVKYAREWYPYGFSIDLTNIRKDKQIRTRNSNFLFTVNLQKTLEGLYKVQEQQNYEGDLRFTIEFDNRFSSFKIASIDEKGGSDTCIKNKQVAQELLSSGACAKAKRAYENVLNSCLSDPDAIAGLKKCDSCMEANKKPLFFTFHLLPGSSNIYLNGSKFGMDISAGSGFNFSLEAGIGVEMALIKWKNGVFSIGAMVDYSNYSGTSLLGFNADTIPDRMDIDGELYTLDYNGTSIKEADELTSVQIPVYVQYQFLVSKSLSIYIKAGGKLGINLVSKYNTTGMFNYKGKYYNYGGVIFTNLPDYNFGTYNENVDASNSEVKMLNISAFGGLGINMSLSKKLDLFIGAEYTHGFSDIGNGNQENRITTGKGQINSLFGVSEVKTRSIGVELGVKWRIFQY